MILNAPSVIAGFLALVQAGLAVSVSIRGIAAVRQAATANSPERRDAAEVAALYPVLQAGALLFVVLLSTALLVEVLSSYVPVWPSVICIEGVTRIGEGSVGASRHLPTLLSGIFFLKPTLLLAGGAWATIHAVNRRASARPGRAGTIVIAVLGALAFADAVLELTYLAIPKEEQFLSSGCCLVTNLVLVDTQRSWLEFAFSHPSAEIVAAVMAASALLQGSALVMLSRRGGRRRLATGTVAVAAACVVTVSAQHFALAVISPRLTGVSTHRCLWCVVEFAPLSAIALAAALGASGLALLATLAVAFERRQPSAGNETSRRLARTGVVALAAATGLALLG